MIDHLSVARDRLPVRPSTIAAWVLWIVATYPFYLEPRVSSDQTVGALVDAVAHTMVGVWPWLAAHPLRLLAAVPMLLWALRLILVPPRRW